MIGVKPLPTYLVTRFHGWQATSYAESQSWYRRLADEGQRPRAMIITCCDSRVHVTALFGAEEGEFFVHRNIASLVPPFAPDEAYHGTSAAVEYAITGLHVTNLIVLGHAHCGGVQAYHDLRSGQDAKVKEDSSFVSQWMEILRPGYDQLEDGGSSRDLEKLAVLTSLENLGTFPFVTEAVEKGELALHGLWTDVAEGVLEAYDTQTKRFVPI